MSSVYRVNKGISKPIEFKGLKAQYIWWLGGGLVCILIGYALLYLVGLNSYICLGFALVAGGGIFAGVYRLSNKYGEFGMMKMFAKKGIPSAVTSKSRKIFIKEN